MLVAETCLLQAVRNRLREKIPLPDEHCDIELDEQLPSVAAPTYYAVIAAGTRPGERHQSSGTVIDLRMDVRVVIYQRITEVARDRRRNVYADLLNSLNAKLDEVIPLLDNDQSVRQQAQLLLPAPDLEDGEFPESFRSFLPDALPRAVMRDPYNAASMNATAADPIVGIARGVTFQQARFMMVR